MGKKSLDHKLKPNPLIPLGDSNLGLIISGSSLTRQEACIKSQTLKVDETTTKQQMMYKSTKRLRCRFDKTENSRFSFCF